MQPARRVRVPAPLSPVFGGSRSKPPNLKGFEFNLACATITGRVYGNGLPAVEKPLENGGAYRNGAAVSVAGKIASRPIARQLAASQAIPGSCPQRQFSQHYGRPVAALDLGTNNCRLLVARPASTGFRVVDAFSRIVRLGEGLEATGALSEEAVRAHPRRVESVRRTKSLTETSSLAAMLPPKPADARPIARCFLHRCAGRPASTSRSSRPPRRRGSLLPGARRY